MEETVIILELSDLLQYNKTMQNIKVDKNIFDYFVENSCIEIKFVDDGYDIVYTYKMVAEDSDGIYMELME